MQSTELPITAAPCRGGTCRVPGGRRPSLSPDRASERSTISVTDNQENTVLGVCFTSKASCFGDIFQTVLRFFPWREIQGPDGNLPRELLLRIPVAMQLPRFLS